MVVEVYLNGRPLSSIAAWSELKYSERFDGGCWEASWQMEVRPGWHHPVVRRGVLVEIRVGTLVVWAGTLTEPDRDSWSMTAQGLSREAEQFSALNADNSPATNVSVATSQAISRGMPWYTTVLPSWPAHANPVTTLESGSINKVSALWSAAADASGRFWGVGPDRAPYARSRPTSPKWDVAAGVGVLGVADDEFATHLVGRYTVDAFGAVAVAVRGNAAAASRWGRRELDVDLTPYGPMNAARANAILDGMLEKAGPRPGYSNALELGPFDVSAGGVRAFWPLIRAGDGMRLHGVVDESLTPLPFHDIVVGEIRHEVGSQTLYVEPLGLVARDLASIIEVSAPPANVLRL